MQIIVFLDTSVKVWWFFLNLKVPVQSVECCLEGYTAWPTFVLAGFMSWSHRNPLHCKPCASQLDFAGYSPPAAFTALHSSSFLCSWGCAEKRLVAAVSALAECFLQPQILSVGRSDGFLGRGISRLQAGVCGSIWSASVAPCTWQKATGTVKLNVFFVHFLWALMPLGYWLFVFLHVLFYTCGILSGW